MKTYQKYFCAFTRGRASCKEDYVYNHTYKSVSSYLPYSFVDISQLIRDCPKSLDLERSSAYIRSDAISALFYFRSRRRSQLCCLSDIISMRLRRRDLKQNKAEIVSDRLHERNGIKCHISHNNFILDKVHSESSHRYDE